MHKEAQATPEAFESEIQQKVHETVKVMEQNKKAISRWFFKGLLAFNLLLGSVVLWAVVVPHLVQFR